MAMLRSEARVAARGGTPVRLRRVSDQTGDVLVARATLREQRHECVMQLPRGPLARIESLTAPRARRKSRRTLAASILVPAAVAVCGLRFAVCGLRFAVCGLRFAVCGCEHPHQSMTQHPSGLLPAGLGARREPTLPATAGPAGDGIFGSWCLPRTAPTATLQRLRRPRGHRPADVSRPAVSDLPARPPLWRPATRRLRRRRTHKCSGSVDPGSDNAWLLGLFHTGQSDGSMGRTTSCTSAMGSIPTSTARCRWPSAT